MVDTQIRDTASVNLTDNADVIEADVKISGTAGNIATINADGVFVPAPLNTNQRLGNFVVTDTNPTDGMKTVTGDIIDASGAVIGSESFDIPDSSELPDAETTYSLSNINASGQVTVTGTDQDGSATTQTINLVTAASSRLTIKTFLDNFDAGNVAAIALMDRWCDAVTSKVTEV